MRGEERPIMEVTEAINLTAPLIQDDWPCLSSLLRRAQERIFELEEENKRLNGDPVPVTCQTSSAIAPHHGARKEKLCNQKARR